MSLAKPPDWPVGLPAPLFLAQAEEVRQWQAATYEEVAVVVHCRRCRRPVGDVLDLTLEDDGLHFYLPIGSVYRGTKRSADRRLEVAKGGRVTAGGGGSIPPDRPGDRRYVPLDDQYLACLETPSVRLLPAVLPGWCDRHGHLGVERRALVLALATWRRKSPARPVAVDAAPFDPPRAN